MNDAILKLQIPTGGATSTQDHNEHVAALFEDFAAEGRAKHNPRPMNEWQVKARDERKRLDALFPAMHGRDEHRDKESIIRLYHRAYYAAQFPFGMPDHFLGPQKVGAIVRAIERNGELS